ncbi:Oxidoreductase, molybdopterin-binding domain-containing protein [Thelonectria olida]|uniref:Nitrate reductase [NADPH] n=1 Tax=Thelonectria olida TaxID=1576542 RepID=A0A9P8VXC3_9HYPO|nr:Oxidoreductase, molybdopterin-binding domain-containing protein [Thelonectria olida]
MSAFSPSARRIITRLSRPRAFPPSQAASSTAPQCRFFNSTPTKQFPHPSPRKQHIAYKYPGFQTVALLSGAASLVFAVSLYHATPTKCDSPITTSPDVVDTRDASLPRFRIQDVRKHHGTSDRPWVIHGDKVYDITDWIEGHPGGDVILRAAGGSIEPYWDIFAIHKNDYVLDILKQYLIGLVDAADLVDGKPAREEIEDPFADDPERHPALITMTSKPRNAETPADAMASDFLTPNELFYVRNHMWVPTVAEDPGKHTLTIELPNGDEKVYTLDQLKIKFPTRRVTAALQCSGNRRRHMSEGSGRKANGLPWNVGAISNACWEGVFLSDVLADAGFDVPAGVAGTSDAKHVQFSGLEAYGASIPIKKAVDPQGDVLLAYGMNGQPLPRDHGFPLRAIVPGHVAARSVKWLSRVTLSDEESWSQWQRKDYKCFGPNQTHVDWETAPAIQEMPVQSAITGYKLGEWTKTTTSNDDKTDRRRYVQQASLSGYAYSGGGRAIVRVDVSLDNGKSWSQAKIIPDRTKNDSHGSWSWRRWTYDGCVPMDAFSPITSQPEDDQASRQKRCATFIVKATDESYNTQPESHAATWNVRGNLATAWHRLSVYSNSPPAPSGEEGPDDPYEGWENI